MRTKAEIKRFIKSNTPKWRQTGQKYRECREALGLTCTYTAECLGISRSTLAKFENGEPMHSYERTATTYATVLAYEELKQSLAQMMICLLPEDAINKLID